MSHSAIRAGTPSTYGRCGAERRAGLVQQVEKAAQRGRIRLKEMVGSYVNFKTREQMESN